MPELATYRLDAYDASGAFSGSLTGTAAGGSMHNSGFLSLSCLRRVNAPGLLTFNLRGDHPLLADLADKWQFELWRKPLGEVWAREFVGVFRADSWIYGEQSSIVLYCPGILSLLGYPIINYPANTSSRSAFNAVSAETVMKTLVTYNITSSATTGNGRKRNYTGWPATEISVESDGAGGNAVTWYCMGQNLLESLQKLAPIAGGDFDLVKTGTNGYQFRWYAGQLGTDRSASVKFALGLGNMGMPQSALSRSDERTVACVWGKGEEAARDYATRTGANYAAGNDLEMFVEATNVEQGDTSGLNARGDEKLREMEAKRTFRFDALQAPATLYGVHYVLGDLVSVLDPRDGSSYTQKVDAVTQTLDPDGNQKIEIELAVP